MRSPLLCLAAGLLLLAACDGKKKYPTEGTTGLAPRTSPAPASVVDTLARVIAVRAA